MAQTATVTIDFLAANAIVAALQQRHRTLTGHVENGVSDPVLDAAIRHTLRAEDAVRRAFHLQTEAHLDALHESNMADLADLAVLDIPLALDTYWNRGA